MFRYSFVGALYNNLILNGIIFGAENAFTLAEWLSVTIPRTQSPISLRLSMLSLIFTTNHCPLNVTSGWAWLWNGLNNERTVDCFYRTTIGTTIPLYKFPSLSTHTCSSDWYWGSISEVHYGAAHLLTISWNTRL